MILIYHLLLEIWSNGKYMHKNLFLMKICVQIIITFYVQIVIKR